MPSAHLVLATRTCRLLIQISWLQLLLRFDIAHLIWGVGIGIMLDLDLAAVENSGTIARLVLLRLLYLHVSADIKSATS